MRPTKLTVWDDVDAVFVDVLSTVTVPIPIAETFIAASLAKFVGADSFPSGVVTIAMGDFKLTDENRLTGNAHSVAFARWAGQVYIPARTATGFVLCVVDQGALKLTEKVNIAGEPRDRIEVELKLDNSQIYRQLLLSVLPYRLKMFYHL